MPSMLSRKSIATTAVIAALTVGAVVPVAFAQSAATEDALTPEAGLGSDSTHGLRHAARQAEFATALAEELDLDSDTVAAALERVQEAMEEEAAAEHRAALRQRLDAAVEAGELTQEQADALLAADEAGVLRGFGGHPGPGPGGPGGPGGRSFGPGGFAAGA